MPFLINSNSLTPSCFWVSCNRQDDGVTIFTARPLWVAIDNVIIITFDLWMDCFLLTAVMNIIIHENTFVTVKVSQIYDKTF